MPYVHDTLVYIGHLHVVRPLHSRTIWTYLTPSHRHLILRYLLSSTTLHATSFTNSHHGPFSVLLKTNNLIHIMHKKCLVHLMMPLYSIPFGATRSSLMVLAVHVTCCDGSPCAAPVFHNDVMTYAYHAYILSLML